MTVELLPSMLINSNGLRPGDFFISTDGMVYFRTISQYRDHGVSINGRRANFKLVEVPRA